MGDLVRARNADLTSEQHARVIDQIEDVCERILEQEEAGRRWVFDATVRVPKKSPKGTGIPMGCGTLVFNGPAWVCDLVAQLRRTETERAKALEDREALVQAVFWLRTHLSPEVLRRLDPVLQRMGEEPPALGVATDGGCTDG